MSKREALAARRAQRAKIDTQKNNTVADAKAKAKKDKKTAEKTYELQQKMRFTIGKK